MSPTPFFFLGGGLGPTYDDHLKLIGKHVGDFLFMLIELFSLGVRRYERFCSNECWCDRCDRKFQVGVAPQQPFF